jgi:tetratricopeptide (TPR) repeat protein
MAYANKFDRNRPGAPREGGAGEQMAERAVALAAQGQWTEAARINQEILKSHPKDTRTLNRLGKCLTEMGNYEGASAAYKRTLDYDQQNGIARKNLDRLKLLAEQPLTSAPEPVAAAYSFITDVGKSTVAVLNNPADPEALAATSPGAELELRAERRGLNVYDRLGRPMGRVAPQLARRLLTLMKGGNTYQAALASVAGGTVRVAISETYRHPSQANTPSFLAREDSAAVRAYTREGLPRSADDEADDEDEDGDDAPATLEPADGDYPEAEMSEAEERDPFAAESPGVVHTA